MLTKGLALSELTAARLREMLHYDPETGLFTRRVTTGYRGCHRAGSVAGSRHCLGYVEIGLDGGRHLSHRLAFLYMTGAWPADQIDHINGVRADNRWRNLREVDNTTNIENRRGPNKNNRSGWLGCHQERGGCWVAQVTVQRRQIIVGRFVAPEEAHAAYLKRKRQVHKGCTL